MNQIPTAKEFLSTIVDDKEFDKDWENFLRFKHPSTWESYLEDCLIRFAKLNVQAALEAAAESAEISCGPPCCVDTESILNAYSLDQII